MEIEAFGEVLRGMGFNSHFHQHMSAVAQDCRDGVCSGTNDLVEKLTGQKPLEMVDYIAKNKALFSRAGDHESSAALRAVTELGGPALFSNAHCFISKIIDRARI